MTIFEIIMTILNLIAVLLIPVVAVFVGQYLQERAQRRKTILDKGIMPSEKVLDFPVDCNTLTGSVNL